MLLGEQIMDYFSIDIDQAVDAAGVVAGEAPVVDPHEVEVADRDFVFGG